jgi:hypothetical protein
MKKIMLAASGLFALCMPLISIAHPGHGETGGYTITHYFVEPTHAVVSLLALTIVVFYVRHLSKNRQHN